MRSLKFIYGLQGSLHPKPIDWHGFVFLEAHGWDLKLTKDYWKWSFCTATKRPFPISRPTQGQVSLPIILMPYPKANLSIHSVSRNHYTSRLRLAHIEKIFQCHFAGRSLVDSISFATFESSVLTYPSLMTIGPSMPWPTSMGTVVLHHYDISVWCQ